jgi:hypothetical protein
MDLNEISLEHEISVESADTGLDLENGLICWNSQVNNSIVESDVLLNDGTLLLALFGLFFSSTGAIFGGLVGDESACIFDLEWQDWCRFVDHPKFLDD